MKKKTKMKNSTKELRLDGKLTIDTVGDLKTKLAASIEEFDNVVLDLRDVSEVTLPAAQLLCSAHQTAKQSGKTLALGKEFPESLVRLLSDSAFANQEQCFFEPEANCLWNRGGHQ